MKTIPLAIPKPTPLVRERKRLRRRIKGVAPALRHQVFERDRHTCQWCEQPGGHLDPHHWLPRSRGGRDELDNLVSVHRLCHRYIHEHPTEARERGFTL